MNETMVTDPRADLDLTLSDMHHAVDDLNRSFADLPSPDAPLACRGCEGCECCRCCCEGCHVQ